MISYGWTLSLSSSIPGFVCVQSSVEKSSNWTIRRRKRINTCKSSLESVKSCFSFSLALLATTAVIAAASSSSSVATTAAAAAAELGETLSNIPQTLSGECTKEYSCKKAKIQRPKSRKAESCTIKCVTTCIRGGEGEGPLNLTRPLVVFKQGFRTRQYCLVECSDICNLISDVEDGP